MEYIRTTLMHLLGVLIILNICIVLVPRSMRRIIMNTLKLLFKVTKFIFNNASKIITEYNKKETSDEKKKGTTRKKAVGETTSNVIPFSKKH